ncbi:hypothetical protein R8871_03085 [Paraburkholderia graminis C4D1M]|jgi:CheY-like chemotaxis protein|uniref:Response regulator receiver protein n=1 Tax=Paraburkholderia graminis (strain ATCC 700544 / DSM 17151 / LMG 18924 / NCIMB 13744 / C4D1M) TaxID=396598 RepID=B1FXQ0_PARG4|nr:response regulator [Paraburkholderia graminis]EDT11226.1 response regulator receiver protein [Paraburkholderia graminis C4D1M]CAB3692052.1 hypothetical protein R8871_03085 [Paraburkholderia graminis C4D1M]
MSIDIMLVEDNEHKRERVRSLIREVLPDAILYEAASYASGCQLAESREYRLIVLDISLPTYERAAGENGGRFRPFGGQEIARKILRRGTRARILFITQYQAFSDRGNSFTFEDLGKSLSSECGDNFLGLVYFDSSKSSWKLEVEKKLKDLK